jgi:hypothetical protein
MVPRDAIHITSALSKAVDVVVSDDSDLDIIKEVRREFCLVQREEGGLGSMPNGDASCGPDGSHRL